MTIRTDREVAAARHALRQLLSRRDFVAASAVAGVGLLGLGGCGSDPGTGGGGGGGGGGNTSMPSGAQSVTGSVTLPAGSTLKPSDLSVDIFTQTVPVSASGGFTVGISPSGPSLALLTDQGGDAVLMAMWDPAASAFAIDSRTSAVALLAYGMGAYLLPSDAMASVLALINADPSVAAVESAVARSVASDPHAMANNAAPLAPAIRTALTAMLGGSLRTERPVAARLRVDGAPALMKVEPSGEQDGLDVNQDVSTTSLLITNVKRRPCRAYIYEINNGTPPPGGNPPPDISPAKLVAGPLEIDSTESLGLITGIKDLFSGTIPWSPVNLPPFLLNLDGAADETIYEVVILAAAAKWVLGKPAEPVLFSDPHFVDEVDKWRADTASLLELDFTGNICLPILSILLGCGTIKASQAVIAAAVVAGRAAYSRAADQVLSRIRSGSLGDVRSGVVDVIVDAGDNTIVTPLVKAELQQVIGRAEAVALTAQSVTATATRLAKAGAVFAKLFAVAAIGLDTFDLGAVLLDLVNSDLAATWTATLVRQKLILTPQNPRVSQGDHVVFQVTLPPGIAGNFVYDWTEDSLADKLSDSGANVGAAITTSEQTVTLVTSGSDLTSVNVLVIGYDTSGGSKVEIGRAGTTVAFLKRAEIQPAGAAVDIGQQKLFTVAVDGGLPSGGQYRWTLTGTAGTIGDTNVVTTTIAAINYLGVQGGTDSLHVDVLDNTGTLYAKADAAVTVAGAAFVQFSVAGTWDSNNDPPTGNYTFNDGVAARRPADGAHDVVFMSYDIVGQAAGVAIGIEVPTGAAITAGEVFNKVTGSLGAGASGVQFLLAHDLSDPSQGNNLGGDPDTSGSLTINSIGLLDTGIYVATFSFNITNSGDGVISGSGRARWAYT